MTQGNLFEGPEPVAHTRWGHPETSHEAARTVTGIRSKQRAIWTVLLGFPDGLIDSELVDLYQRAAADGRVPAQAESGIRARRSELVRMGFVIDTGARRLTSHGRRSIVWKAAPF